MNRNLIALLIVFSFLTIQCRDNNKYYYCDDACKKTHVYPKDIDNFPLGVKSLILAYPHFIQGYEDGYLIFRDGTKILYEDQKEKTFDLLLDDADPEDLFAFTYDRQIEKPNYLQDAGRSRCETLFKKMYGSSEDEVKKHLRTIDWFGDKIPFTAINGAKDSLLVVSKELSNHPELRPYLKSSGTFYWRQVRGANRQSAHSYGIAIDIGVDNSDYWLWKNPEKRKPTALCMPIAYLQR